MRKRFAVFMTIVVAGMIGVTASAQNKLKMELSYNVSAPLGSFKNDYISKTSFRGLTGEVSYAFNPKFSVGLHTGFQNYYQKYDRAVYKIQGNETISAVVSNSMDIIPVLVRGTYYPMATSTAKIQPYVSAGAGLNLVSYGQYLGEFGGTQSSTPFAAQAGAGMQIPFGRKVNQTGIKLGATYNYTAYNKNDIKNLNSVGFNAGVVFSLR